MQDWREHYRILKANINDASALLAEILGKCQEAYSELEELVENVKGLHREVSRSQAERDAALSTIVKEQEKLEKKESDLALEVEEIEEFRLLAYQEAEKMKKDASTEIQLKQGINKELDDILKKKEVKLGELDKKFGQLAILGVDIEKKIVERNKLEVLIGELKELQDKSKKEYERENQNKAKELAQLDAKISSNKRSVEGFEENIQKTHSQVSKKVKDLETYEVRLRALYNQIGIPLKDMGIKVPRLRKKT